MSSLVYGRPLNASSAAKARKGSSEMGNRSLRRTRLRRICEYRLCSTAPIVPIMAPPPLSAIIAGVRSPFTHHLVCAYACDLVLGPPVWLSLWLHSLYAPSPCA